MVTVCYQCQSEKIEDQKGFVDQTLFQNIIVRELLEFFSEKVRNAQAQNLDEAQQPDYLLKIASGRFFEVFKRLNQKSNIVRK